MKHESLIRTKSGPRALDTLGAGAAIRGKQRKPSVPAGQPNRTTLMICNIVLGVAAMSVILVSVVMYFGKHRTNPSGSRMPEQAVIVPELPAASTLPDPLGQKETMRIVGEALANRDPERVAEYFAPSSFTDPTEVMGILEEIKSKEGPVLQMIWIGGDFSANRHIEELVVYFGKEESASNRLVQLYSDTDGKWRIDFSSFARTASPPWEVILSGNRISARIRVFVSRENYYNRDFDDETRWRCYALISPDVDEIMYGYVLRSSRQEKALERIMEAEKEFHRATIEVEVHSAASPRQFEISSVLSENWFIGDSPADEEP